MTRAASLEFHTADPALFRSEKSCSFSQTSSERPKSPQPTQENGGKPTLFKKPHQTAAFDTFGPCVRTHSDATHLFIESTGLPSHPMMIGITAWQQQVPLPQSYTGANAGQIPLSPIEGGKPHGSRLARPAPRHAQQVPTAHTQTGHHGLATRSGVNLPHPAQTRQRLSLHPSSGPAPGLQHRASPLPALPCQRIRGQAGLPHRSGRHLHDRQTPRKRNRRGTVSGSALLLRPHRRQLLPLSRTWQPRRRSRPLARRLP